MICMNLQVRCISLSFTCGIFLINNREISTDIRFQEPEGKAAGITYLQPDIGHGQV